MWLKWLFYDKKLPLGYEIVSFLLIECSALVVDPSVSVFGNERGSPETDVERRCQVVFRHWTSGTKILLEMDPPILTSNIHVNVK